MFKIEKNTIHLTRGDSAIIEVKVKNDDGTDYAFKKGESIRFTIVEVKKVEEIVLAKEIQIEKESLSVEVPLYSEETAIGQIINKPKKYWYEVVLITDGEEQTILGYDDEGPKEFILYPEAKE